MYYRRKIGGNRGNREIKIHGKISFAFRNPLLYKQSLRTSENNERKAKENFLNEFKEQVKGKSLRISNFSLLINKFIPIIEANIIGRENIQWFGLDNECIGGETKSYFLLGVIEGFKYINIHKLIDRLDSQIDTLKSKGYEEIVYKIFVTQSRLVVGLGCESVLETSLTLHKIFGIPYVPATALKGVCRALAFWEIADKKEILKIEDEKEKNKKLKSLQEKFYGELQINDEDVLKAQLLFGAQNFKGLLLFLDAYPEIRNNETVFELDIMNVHYPNYYSGNEPPGDWQNPNPIYFLTIKPGLRFKIGVLFDKFRYNNLNSNLKKLDIDNLKSNIESLIKEALSEFGIGAKTRLGYGILGE
ncbi:type III-B CRISPR module RAMP protein Cmr6 [SCandidatus Aminicenantes bacterium Aminicenantia_JdfR_composite]|jgi:CRISPR-associated protein Cmr6|nr:type III-B CRISPR module RAMP protein Cmr6 [SCandidatus Aminicenantes bacterium Aminicenantia_JdfR_composite]MCP2596987.1 type III-B CRISPR module RAMP protein Cmr6 [Candidatus Aminicenantes bacterium AC-335-G13]MCP2598691.1 type III-B CRISPR module RAMP protein Cmr6 [Candidatus Aminicenantes bacterium AC-335-L06]MCP2620621.1 type III-B CRISPR module RAMP protein Cmr6 [Candidatus Aminicenantes bacterium AC-334-E05]